MNHTSREAWLQNAIQALDNWFYVVGDVEIPENIRITVGFGPTGSRTESTRIMGGTLHTRCATDGAIEIFISPESSGAMDMLGTLVHELVHAVLLAQEDRSWWGHSGSFSALARKLGLIGAMMSSYPNHELQAALEQIGIALGPYPGAQVVVSGTGPAPEVEERRSTGPKQQKGSRYRLARCELDDESPCHGFQVRITQKHLDLGTPKCPYGHFMSLV